MSEILKLFSIIVAPIVLILVTTMLLYRNRHKDRIKWSFWKYNTTFDASHGLGSQPLFWITIIYPIGLFFSTGFWAWYGYNLDISEDGFIKFVEISKLPLGLLGLSIPLAVLTARLHGTKQTALQIIKTQKQIEEAQQKNKTDLYLAHYKHFCDYLDELSQSFSEKELIQSTKIHFNKHVLYRWIYPESSISTGKQIKEQRLFILLSKIINSLPKDIKEIESLKYGSKIFFNRIHHLNIKVNRIKIILSITTPIEELFKSKSMDFNKTQIDGASKIISAQNIFLEQKDLSEIINFFTDIIINIYAHDLHGNSIGFRRIKLPPVSPNESSDTGFSNFKILKN